MTIWHDDLCESYLEQGPRLPVLPCGCERRALAPECEGQCQFAESIGATNTKCYERCLWTEMMGAPDSE